MKYEVLVDGKPYWETETDDDTFDKEVIPRELRLRPGGTVQVTNEDGTLSTIEGVDAFSVTHITDGNIIAVLRHQDAPTPDAAPLIVGQAGVNAGNQVGSGG